MCRKSSPKYFIFINLYSKFKAQFELPSYLYSVWPEPIMLATMSCYGLFATSNRTSTVKFESYQVILPEAIEKFCLYK
jgi:hypothetical protein